MTVVIGSQTDVPDTGDPIVSPWYQDTARKLVHQFANVTARDAWTTRPEGAVAYTADTDVLSVWNGSAWVNVNANVFVLRAGDTMAPGGLNVIRDPAGGHGIQLRNDGRISGAITQAGGSVPATSNIELGRGGNTAATGAWFVSLRVNAGSSSAPMTTEIGSIKMTSASAVAYNTTSDPRTKTTAATRGIGDAADRARQLGAQAWRGQYLNADGQGEGDTFDFLSSHDIEDVAGYAVSGERDATDDDGNPVLQQVNYPALVPLLFAALADALARIDALEAAG